MYGINTNKSKDCMGRALGVVATTQVLMVQATVDQLANMIQDTRYVKQVSTAMQRSQQLARWTR